MKPADNRSHRFLWLKRLALMLFAPVMALLVAETICHFAGIGYPTRFLIAWTVDGEEVWIDNQIFGYRFFAPAVSRMPAPIVVQQKKPPDEFRVVVLGESAAMGEPEPAFGPARMLEYLLRDQFPEKKIRVINAAMTAINSHVIREITRELPRIQPDVVVIYMGNNEVVGPFGPGTVFQSPAGLHELNRVRVMLSRLRCVSAFQSWRMQRTTTTWEGMEMFASLRVPQEDPRLELVYDSFQRNLSAIQQHIRKSGAIPLLSTVAVNLADQAPFDGRPFERADYVSVLAARDADALRFRADSRINQIIRDTATHTATRLVDADRDFAQEGPPGRGYFIDHVHFTLAGSHRLAALWCDEIVRILGATARPTMTLAEVETKLSWNVFDAMLIAENMDIRVSREPFTMTRDNAQRRVQWKRELAAHQHELNQADPDQIASPIIQQAFAHPDDFHFSQQLVRFFMAVGMDNDAASWLERLQAHLPHRADVRSWTILQARTLANEQRDSIVRMTRSSPPLGELPVDLLLKASDMLYRSGYPDSSLDLVRELSRRFPHRLNLQAAYASRLALLGHHEEARIQFSHLIQQHAHSPWLKEDFGIYLAVLGNSHGADELLRHLERPITSEQKMKRFQWLMVRQQPQQAEAELMEWLSRDPTFARGWEALGRLMESKGLVTEALSAWDHVTILEPWNGEAWGRIGSLHDQLRRPELAVTAYERAIPLLRDATEVALALAWILATDDYAQRRNPERAKELMSHVRPASRMEPSTLLVVAAIEAALGHFERATDISTTGLSLCVQPAHDAIRDQLERAQQLYTRGFPLRIQY